MTEIIGALIAHAEQMEQRVAELEKRGAELDRIIQGLQASASSSSGAEVAKTTTKSSSGSGSAGSVEVPSGKKEGVFERDHHVKFIEDLSARGDKKEDTFESVAMEHLKMQAMFWALGTLDVLGLKENETVKPLSEIVEFVLACYHPDSGGFGGNVGHDAHLLHTQHAVYVLALCDALDRVDRDKVAEFVAARQQADGSFSGDEWGEIDIRFTYCALVALAVLDRLDKINVASAMDYVVSCQNFDGGFGSAKGVESHAGYIFTAVASLSVGGGLELVSKESWERLSWWLAERQCDSGGLNGRPEKQADVCYSWWVLSSMSILGHVDWIDRDLLIRFILSCQDNEQGGIGDHPGNVGDVYHTFFGVCGLSLLGSEELAKTGKINEIDPTYALPKYLLKKLGLRSE